MSGPLVFFVVGVVIVLGAQTAVVLRDRARWRKTRINLLESKVSHQAETIASLRRELRDARWRAHAFEPKGDI